ncbi:MAG: TIGR04255 family protein [Calothrix sp. MO_192.B10]|nr:TIGR04255 family protein [Calothrix sp. MO_192.B10]
MRFPNPPITEAVFDIRVKLREDFNYEELLEFQNKVKESYPTKKEIRGIKGGIQVNLETPAKIHPNILSVSNDIEGYVFISNDDKKLIQAKLQGFTFSQLRPYQGWDKFSDEAYQLWEKYAQTTLPLKVVRLALRYVNQIMIPVTQEEKIELSNYIKTFPEVSNDLSDLSIESYFMRLVLNSKDYEPSRAIINQTIGQLTKNNENQEFLPLIFDIDVFQEVDILPNNINLIKTIFEDNFKKFRDDIFFNSITEETRELFK